MANLKNHDYDENISKEASKILKNRKGLNEMQRDLRKIGLVSLNLAEFDEKSRDIFMGIMAKSNEDLQTHPRDEYLYLFNKERETFIKNLKK